MTNNYSYPRVTMSVNAKKHSKNFEQKPDTTILFAPLVTEKGPDDKLVKVHSIGEFVNTFGSFNKDFYELNGQAALNVYNWLANGGTLLTKRLTDSGDTKAEGKTYFFKADNFEYLNYVEITGETPTIKNSTVYELTNNGNTYIVNKKITNVVEGEEETTYEEVGSFSKLELSIKAKYAGEFYNDIKVSFIFKNAKVFNVVIANSKKEQLEKFAVLTVDSYKSALIASEYIDFGEIVKTDFLETYIKENEADIANKPLEFVLKGAINSINSYSSKYPKPSTCTAVIDFYKNECATGEDKKIKYLSNPNLTVVDVILDAGYSADIKQQMVKFVSNAEGAEGPRTDITLYLDAKELSDDLRLNNVKETDISTASQLGLSEGNMPNNIFIYKQHFIVDDPMFAQQNIYVTPTYFLSKLIPYNDRVYGIQHPTAGLRRGILEDAIWVDENPDAATKNAWFESRLNYAEQSSREFAFMSQRSFDGSDDLNYTALSFINNVRVTEKIKKELKAIARNYLHEFNDAKTIADMTNALNKYVGTWLSNRTLSLGTVEVSQNEESENALDIDLNIKFTNTIEVINIKIVIE